MAKLTKAQARKRLEEAKQKLMLVYLADYMTTQQFAKVETEINRAKAKLK